MEKILNQEIHVRKQNSINNRIRNARFPYRILLDDYKREHLSIEIRQKIKELETLEFLDNNENIILIGNPGTGKTTPYQ